MHRVRGVCRNDSCDCCMPIKNPNTSVNLAIRHSIDIGDEGGILCR